MTDKEIWDNSAFVIGSKYRREIVIHLKETPSTATLIARKKKWDLSLTSRALLELLKENIVEVINKDSSKSRVYKLTENGKKVFEKVNKMLEN